MSWKQFKNVYMLDISDLARAFFSKACGRGIVEESKHKNPNNSCLA